jgi:hypothetical protein
MNINKTSKKSIKNANELIGKIENEKHKNLNKTNNNKKNNYINTNRNSFEYLINNIPSINEETKSNDRRLLNDNNKISPCLPEILFNRPSKSKKLKNVNYNYNNLRISLKTLQLNNTIPYKKNLLQDDNNNTQKELESEVINKINEKDFINSKMLNSINNIEHEHINENINEHINGHLNENENENEIILNELDNIIEIEENLENNKEDLNKKLKQIRKTVNTLKRNTYDSNSTNEINYASKIPIFSEEELNKEVQKINDHVKILK